MRPLFFTLRGYQESLDSIARYTDTAAEFAAVTYIRGSLDAPRYLDSKNILILFPTVTGEEMIQFGAD